VAASSTAIASPVLAAGTISGRAGLISSAAKADLPALGATIEAPPAGEAGTGFAIVAREAKCE
jgi:methyl-accepting chemotaxis protein